jgi:hypothetical protein
MQYCERCGRQLGQGVMFCSACGTAVNAQVLQPTSMNVPPATPATGNTPVIYAPPQRSGGRTAMWVVLGLVGCVLLVVVVLAIFGAGMAARQNANPIDVSSTTPPSSSAAAPAPSPQPVVDVAAIRSVLTQDADYRGFAESAVKNMNVKSLDDVDKVAGLMRTYISKAQGIDTSACPPDFAEAYSRNISAWVTAADIVESHPQMPTDDDDVTQVRASFNDWVQRLQNAGTEIDRAKGELDALAARYGVH